MIVFDFEVLKYNWLVVFLDLEKREYIIIHDNKFELELFYNQHKNDIFIGYNAKNYDKYIFQGILSDINPYLISQHIIEYKMNGYDFRSIENDKYPLIIFDCMKFADGGLKTLEGFMGNDIEESKIELELLRRIKMVKEKNAVDNEKVKILDNEIDGYFEMQEEKRKQIEELKEGKKIKHNYLKYVLIVISVVVAVVSGRI